MVRLTTATLLSLVLLAIGAPSSSRAQARKPTFEVTSVKKNVSESPMYGASLVFQARRAYNATNVPLFMLLLSVYDLRSEQLVGGPAWIRTDRFDIAGRAEREVSREEMILMIQALLEDRFKLRMSRETRQQDVYVLTRARDGLPGPNLHYRTDDQCKETLERRLAGIPTIDLPTPVNGLRPRMGTVCVPIGEVAAAIGRQLQTDVVDKTGLEGLWDYILAFNRPSSSGDEAATDPRAGPSLPVAVQEQLGLRLERQRGVVEVFAIESIEQPTQN